MNESAHGIAAKYTNTAIVKVAFFLEYFNSSVKKATLTSKIEIAEVTAAIDNKTKNKSAKKYPPVNWESNGGKTWNTSPGPAVGSYPDEKTTVNIATPAIIAINVSRKATR